MMSTSALCFMLVLSLLTTCAHLLTIETVSPIKYLELTVEKISSKAAHDMAQVAKAADGLSTLELNDRLLDTLRNSLKTMEPLLHYTRRVKPSDMARRIALKISQNQELFDALVSRGKIAPRFIGALVLGITQIVTDFTKMIFTRY